jgi:hypothetical protein
MVHIRNIMIKSMVVSTKMESVIENDFCNLLFT